MNYLDYLFILIFLYACWRGFKKGFVLSLFTLLALLVGLYAGLHFSEWTSAKLQTIGFFQSKYTPVIAFTITFLLIGAMVYFLGVTLEKVLKIAQMSLLNKLAGVLFSLLKFLYLLSFLLIVFESYDRKSSFITNEVKNQSLLYHPIKKVALKTIPTVEEMKFYAKETLTDSSEVDTIR